MVSRVDLGIDEAHRPSCIIGSCWEAGLSDHIEWRRSIITLKIAKH